MNPPVRPPAPDLVVTELPRSVHGAVVESLRRGDKMGLIRALAQDPHYAPDTTTKLLADLLVEYRRQNVAVLGSADAFVRKTTSGELRQVIRGVTLSLDDGTLYQLPGRRQKVLAADMRTPYTDDHAANRLGYEWIDVPKHPDRATVSFEGYLRMNAVAGCSVQLPERVLVDGQLKPNPHIHRDEDGDIARIVIYVVVAGAVPDTGNIAVVQYLLDVDVRMDLVQMLLGLLTRKRYTPKKRRGASQEEEEEEAPPEVEAVGGHVQPMTRTDYNEWKATMEPAERRKWAWIRQHGPVGLAYNLTHPAVLQVWEKYLGILQNAAKKAQTVAMRNAMKRHPALARGDVFLNGRTYATIGVTGWTSAGTDIEQYDAIVQAIARGEALPEGVHVVEAAETYDPVRDNVGDPELDVPPDLQVQDTNETARILARNELVREIEDAILDLSPQQVVDLGISNLGDISTEDLAAIAKRARALGARS